MPCRSLHHALLTKRTQVLRDKMTELERRKQQLRIDSGQDSQSTEEMVAKKESLQYSLDELRARLEVIESEKAALTVEEDQQYAAESSQQVKVITLQKKVEALNKEMEAKKATIAENGLKMHYRYRKKGKVRAMRVSSHFGLFKQTPLSVVASPVLMENKAKEAESPKSPSINWKRSLNRVKSEMKDQRVNRPSGAPGDYLVWHLDTGEQLSMSSERFHDIYQLDLNYLHSPATHSPHGHSRTNSIDSQGGRSRVHSEGRSHRRTKSNLKLLSTFNGSADAPSVDSPSVAGAATSFRHGPKRDNALTSLSNLPAIADTSKSLSRSGPELQHVLSKVIEREDSSKNTKTTEKQVDVVISPVPGMLH